MEAFTILESVAMPFDTANVDTDQIIPARFLGKPREEMGRFLLQDRRPSSPFDDAAYRGARILVAGENFGCGSSREQAVWALQYSPESDQTNAFRCVIAPSFGDIFYANACKNGLLPVRLAVAAKLREELRARPGAKMTVDLEKQIVIGPDGAIHRFEIDSFQRECLLRGLEDIELTLAYSDEVEAYEQRKFASSPWRKVSHTQ